MGCEKIEIFITNIKNNNILIFIKIHIKTRVTDGAIKFIKTFSKEGLQ